MTHVKFEKLTDIQLIIVQGYQLGGMSLVKAGAELEKTGLTPAQADQVLSETQPTSMWAIAR